MKDYLVDVKFIQKTSMKVNAYNKRDAIRRIDNLLKQNIKDKSKLTNIFGKDFYLKYKISKINR